MDSEPAQGGDAALERERQRLRRDVGAEASSASRRNRSMPAPASGRLAVRRASSIRRTPRPASVSSGARRCSRWT
jgi:hypothetical protein